MNYHYDELDPVYVAELADRMQDASNIGNGHRSAAYELVERIADLLDKCEELPRLIEEYQDIARQRSTEVAQEELERALYALPAYATKCGLDKGIVPDSFDSVEDINKWLSELSLEDTDKLYSYPKEDKFFDLPSEGSRGWIITYLSDGTPVVSGWALIHSLDEDEYDYVEVFS